MADWVVPSIISLLNCSPNLEALTIYFEGVISTPKIIAFVRHCFFYLFTFIISLIYELKIKAFQSTTGLTSNYYNIVKVGVLYFLYCLELKVKDNVEGPYSCVVPTQLLFRNMELG